jgi:exopolyphosphatase/pppGpp-phosphohydrolase
LPFSVISIAIGPGRTFERFTDAEEIEQARAWLEEELDRMTLDMAQF